MEIIASIGIIILVTVAAVLLALAVGLMLAVLFQPVIHDIRTQKANAQLAKENAEKWARTNAEMKARKDSYDKHGPIGAYLLTLMNQNPTEFNSKPDDAARKNYILSLMDHPADRSAHYFTKGYQSAFNMYAPHQVKLLAGKGSDSIKHNESIVEAAARFRASERQRNQSQNRSQSQSQNLNLVKN